jgi:hypothetical protein
VRAAVALGKGGRELHCLNANAYATQSLQLGSWPVPESLVRVALMEALQWGESLFASAYRMGDASMGTSA